MSIKREDLEAAGRAVGEEMALSLRNVGLNLDSKSWEKFDAERAKKPRSRTPYNRTTRRNRAALGEAAPAPAISTDEIDRIYHRHLEQLPKNVLLETWKATQEPQAPDQPGQMTNAQHQEMLKDVAKRRGIKLPGAK
jgi:hypothetical protein